jgi:hypothetical protein
MEKELLHFIAKAKKQAYASTSSKPKRTKDDGKTYTIKQGNYTYTDTYFGNLIDCGQERIYFKGKVIWMMAYRGGMCKGKESMDNEAFSFLKTCISRMPKQFPARGPKMVNKGDWKYENKWQGNIEGFTGEESIYYKGEQVCFRNYVGGLVRNKVE